jgi:glycosyltransferase involved in cell wall biosynthesis
VKIAFVSSGNSVHVKKLANGLVEKGHEITLFTLPNHNKLIKGFDNRVRIKFLPIGGKIGYYLNAPFLNRYIKNEKFDLLNSHNISGYGTLARLANIKPLVSAVFGSDVYIYPYKSKSNMKRVIKNLDAAQVITSTSNVMADAVRKFYKRERDILVTPFGVNLDVFKPNLEYDKEDSTFTFGIVKKLEEVYGIEILIKAFSRLINNLSGIGKVKVRLMIYGFGSKEEYYKRLTDELRISRDVTFNGFIANTEVPKAFYKMDVACFPSLSESFGVAAIEAMACGVPVITSDASGFTEVVDQNVTGFIIPKNDIDALADKMLETYMMDKKTLELMGENGYKRVSELYDFEKNLETYIKALETAIEV